MGKSQNLSINLFTNKWVLATIEYYYKVYDRLVWGLGKLYNLSRIFQYCGGELFSNNLDWKVCKSSGYSNNLLKCYYGNSLSALFKKV